MVAINIITFSEPKKEILKGYTNGSINRLVPKITQPSLKTFSSSIILISGNCTMLSICVQLSFHAAKL